MKNLHGLLLAAGKSERLGRPKQLIDYQGNPLVRHIAEVALAAQLDSLTIVTGAHSEKVNAALKGLSVQIRDNEDWARGMGSSIAAGAKSILAKHPDATGILILLSDQPNITSEHLLNLQNVFERKGAYLAVSAYKDTFGVPALVGRNFFDDLLKLEGDQGAKQIFIKEVIPDMQVAFPDAALDIDTPEDLAKFESS